MKSVWGCVKFMILPLFSFIGLGFLHKNFWTWRINYINYKDKCSIGALKWLLYHYVLVLVGVRLINNFEIEGSVEIMFMVTFSLLMWASFFNSMECRNHDYDIFSSLSDIFFLACYHATFTSKVEFINCCRSVLKIL